MTKNLLNSEYEKKNWFLRQKKKKVYENTLESGNIIPVHSDDMFYTRLSVCVCGIYVIIIISYKEKEKKRCHFGFYDRPIVSSNVLVKEK